MRLSAEERTTLQTRGGEMYRLALKENRKLTDAEQSELRGIERKLDSDEYEMLHGTPDPQQQAVAQQRFTAGAGEQRSSTERPLILTPEMRMRDYVRGSYAPEQESLNLGKYIRGIVTGNWHEAEAERRAMSEASGSALHTIPTPLSANLIDSIRNRSIAFQAGCRLVPMTSATQKFAKLTTDFTAAWYAENASISSSDGVFSALTFTAKKVAALAKLSRELVEDAPNAGDLVESALAEVLAAEMDRVVWHGSGSGAEPTGLYSASGTQSVAVGGALSDHSKFVEAFTKLLTVNATPNTFVYAPRSWQSLEQMVDGDGNPLVAPQSFRDARKLVSNQISITLGSGSDSVAFAGGFDAVGIGMRQNIQVEISREAATAFADDQVWIKATARCDVQLFRANHIVKLTGITA